MYLDHLPHVFPWLFTKYTLQKFLSDQYFPAQWRGASQPLTRHVPISFGPTLRVPPAAEGINPLQTVPVLMCMPSPVVLGGIHGLVPVVPQQQHAPSSNLVFHTEATQQHSFVDASTHLHINPHFA